MSDFHNNHDHICFIRRWSLDRDQSYQLGECEALLKAICNTPLRPDNHKAMLGVALVRGAQATTAIEGNTLTDEEIEQIRAGQKNLPPSREYQEREVDNILKALSTIMDELATDQHYGEVTTSLIKRFHVMVGDGIGENFDATPGQLRRRNVTVGPYRAPSFETVPEMLEEFCGWIEKEFPSQDSTFENIILKAIGPKLIAKKEM